MLAHGASGVVGHGTGSSSEAEDGDSSIVSDFCKYVDRNLRLLQRNPKLLLPMLKSDPGLPRDILRLQFQAG